MGIIIQGNQKRAEKIQESMNSPISIDASTNIEISYSNQKTEKKYKCTACGASWDIQKSHFSKSSSPLFQSNNGYIHICNKCRDDYYNELVSLYKGNEEHAIRHMCIEFGWVYHIDALVAARQISDDRSRISHYLAKKNLGQTAEVGTTYIDSLKFDYENKLIEEKKRVITSAEDIEDITEFELTPRMIKFWGTGYDPKVYPMLQGYYDELLKLCEKKPDVKKQKMMKNLCLLEYQMQINIQAGKDIGTLSNSYKSMFEAAELKVDEADTSNDAFGKWIMDIEKYSPAEYYKDKNKYHDFFGIIEYIERFMFRPLKNLIFGTKEKEEEFWINEEEVDTKGGE